MTTQAPPTGVEPLRRPREGRVVAGVAAGLAKRLQIPEWIVRVAFVLMALSGGFGVVLYAAGWFLIPEEGKEQSHANRVLGTVEGPAAWIGIVLIGIALLIVIDWGGFVRGDLAVASILIVAGVLLFRGEFGTRSNTKPEKENMTMTETRSQYTPAPKPPRPPSHLGRITIAALFITIGGLALADQLSAGFDPTARHYLGISMAVLGVGLLVGSFFGRARWLIVVGFIMVPTMLVAAVADLTVEGGIGERRYSPTEVSEVSDQYRLAVGEMTIDLGDLNLGGETVVFEASVGIGQLTVIVPDDAALDIEARSGMGDVVLLGQRRDGLGVSNTLATTGSSGTLVLDLRTNIGEVRVIDDGGAASTASARFGDTIVVSDAADLESEYRFDAGSYTFDFSGLSLDSVRTVSIRVDTGSIEVILPNSIGVSVNANVSVGDIDMAGQSNAGLNVSDQYRTGERILLELDIEMGAGKITVEGRR